MLAEKQRLVDSKKRIKNWRKWGPYLSERQWGTVREDYSSDGEAWDYITHDNSRSYAYRWGEEGIAGFSDHMQRICFSIALWNGKDTILKERLFGLNGNEGNHGEDVKEYYYYLDNTPTHSYMKMLYKYPINEFPYDELIKENSIRNRKQSEFELIDTEIFDNDEYIDIIVEYAKQDFDDIFIKITAINRSDKSAKINIIPQIWFRNTWSWKGTKNSPMLTKSNNFNAIKIDHEKFKNYKLYFDENPQILFCDNNTNFKKLYGSDISDGYFKDGLNDYIVDGLHSAINRDSGTKTGINYNKTIESQKSTVLYFRITNKDLDSPFSDSRSVFDKRISEADEFYSDIQKNCSDADKCNIQRQAFAGMLWNKQFYHYDVEKWFEGDAAYPKPSDARKNIRNADWEHLNNADIISMPDKWEYPWYATWDSAFHMIPFAMIDPDFAKDQLLLFTREWYMHANGQLPAYEWNFSDVNPPVHAWATWRVFKIDEKHNNKPDYKFLERVFHKLLLNFTWWVNRKDKNGHNIFQGGFLGLDNIGVFNRSKDLPFGGHIDQSDGTSWMAMYCLNMLRIALELSKVNSIYQDTATKFFEHFLHIAEAMNNIGDDGNGLWDEKDGFYYDVLNDSSNNRTSLKIRSIVGLIPLFAVEVLEPDLLSQLPDFKKRLNWFMKNKPKLAKLVSRWNEEGKGERHLLSLLRGHRMKLLLKKMLDETEFLSEFGIRSLSKYHKNNPYKIKLGRSEYSVKYAPAESDTPMFGGNSNWRGPIWFPINFLLVESIERFYHYYGDDFKIEYPTNSGEYFNLAQVADKLSDRLISIFQKDTIGNRPVNRNNDKFQSDPNFNELIPFFEYFHGDSGAGLGASHQTGWTGLIAKLIQYKVLD